MDELSPNRTETEAIAAQSAAAVNALRTRAQQMLDERQERMAEIERRITAQIGSISDELAREAAATQSEAATATELESLHELRSEFERERGEWDQIRQQQDADLTAARQAAESACRDLAAKDAELTTQAAQLLNQQELVTQKCEEIDQLSRQIEQERQEWDNARTNLEATVAEQTDAIEQLWSQLQEIEEQHRESQQTSHSESTELQSHFAEQSAAWDAERESLASELQATRDQLVVVQQQATETLGEEQALRQKFELALEDVRRLRLQVSELEQELSARPESNETESPEVTHLRGEREQLVEKISTLETRLEKASSRDSSQEQADLRRRFELAVEDVRQLKTENAKLEQAVANARTSPGIAVEASATDWEAQKQRLLASLEGEDTPTPERQQERASIDGTIRITDEVVAEKDREIAALQEQLEEIAGATDDERILDADEVIRAERERLTALEAELHEKLRAAEMELSVGRAKITRQQSELEQQRIELETFKNALPGAAGSGAGSHATSKRRWLSKLGLGGDDET